MENTTTFEIVPRPTETESSNEFIAAFVETAKSGHAMRLPLEGTNYRRITARLQSICRSRELKQHVHRDGADHVVIWATKKEVV